MVGTAKKLRYERRVWVLALAAGLPASAVAVVFIFLTPLAFPLKILFASALAIWLAALAGSARDRAARPWLTLASMLSAVRQGDYSTRARTEELGGAVQDALAELNLLGDSLRARRLESLEAAALLGKVLEEIDTAIFTFDEADRLQLVNRAGARLIGRPAEMAVGLSATDAGLQDLLEGESAIVDHMFAGAGGRWAVRHSSFREGGKPHRLLLVSDLTRELREEELQAWQRLVRVLGHELNNSLAPIQSMAQSLESMVRSDAPAPEWKDDAIQALQVIASRSESLSRFVGAYARLARLPKPVLKPVPVESFVRGVLELRKERIELRPGPSISVLADRDQIEQVLINLLQNAADAVAPGGGGISVGWQRTGSQAEIWVEDEGGGVGNPGNLFVPFFSTKPGGSGIGLVLSRKISEAHNGWLTLENRSDGRGSIARLRLPLGE